jgi:hypothetical protein
MAAMTEELERIIDHIPFALESEFPQVPMRVIERNVHDEVRALVAQAHFNDFVPLFVHKHVRERLRAVH